ncbi:MAG: hypothetical protein WC477_00560 [Patescibacteria group bacterium]
MSTIRKKKKNAFAETAWKIFIIIVGITMVLGMVLPFVNIASGGQ